MPDPTVNEGHYDEMLTTLSVAWMQSAEGFVADKVFPVVPVAKASSFYWKYPRGYFLRDEVGPRPMGGYSRSVGYKLEKGTYYCEEEGLTSWLDDRERANSTPPHDPERGKVNLLTSQHMIHRDRQWADGYFRPGVWSTTITGVAATPGPGQALRWNDGASNPVRQVMVDRRRIGQTTGFQPNVLVLGSSVEIELLNHPDLIDRYKQVQPGFITRDLLAGIFGVDRVVVPTSIWNAAAEGAPDDINFIVGPNDALLVYANPNPGLDQPSGGYIMAWTGLLGPNAFATPAVVWRGRDERAHSDWFEVRQAFDMHVVAPDLGVYYTGIVA